MDKEKLLLYVCFLGVVLIVATVFVGNRTSLGGAANVDYAFSGVTNAAITCAGATSSLIQATTSGRVFFSVSASSTGITLCRSGICYAGSSTIVAANTTFTQDDGYI